MQLKGPKLRGSIYRIALWSPNMPYASRRLALLNAHLGNGIQGQQDQASSVTAVPTGLLKGIDPILTAELLYVLRMAGHGDVISIVDCNFPAAEVASKTFHGKVRGRG